MKTYNIVYLVTACNKVGPIQQTFNIINHLDRSRFTPILITLYAEPEDGTSQLYRFLEIGVVHHHVPTSKTDILLNRLSSLKQKLQELQPSVIHSLGVFPDYAVMKLEYSDRQLITLRNYMKEDYLSKYGIVQGSMLSRLQMKAVKRAAKVVTCSKSLSDIYRNRISLSFEYICNGIDVSQYHRVSEEEKVILRNKLNLPEKKKIFTYSGQFIPRKNQDFLMDIFASTSQFDDALLLLLGDGSDYDALRQKYGFSGQIEMRGMVTNVNEYLQASDVYISSSLSEGMPNGVLEAMATGLPVVLSDIPQHKELFEANSRIGRLYKSCDRAACIHAVEELLHFDFKSLGDEAEKCARHDFNAINMSQKYQNEYMSVMTD